MGCRGRREERAAAATTAEAMTVTTTMKAMLSGGRSLFRNRDRGHIRALTRAAIAVMRRQTQRHWITTTTDVLGGQFVGDAWQSSESEEVCGDDTR